MTSMSKPAKSVRNFLYLDSDKLRSHSSQVFEGVTEYVSKSLTSGSAETAEQKGPVGSGRILGDILKTEGSSTEYRFLEDYAYTLFDDKLTKDGRVERLDPKSTSATFDRQYVKIVSKLSLNDLREVVRLVTGFNQFGESMYRVIHQQAYEEASHGKPLSDPDVKTKAKAAGMTMDRKFLEALTHVLEFGFQDLIEANMMAAGYTFSGPLKRESLREDAKIIIQKYSRYSQRELTMLGVITQVGKNETPTNKSDVGAAGNVKEAIRHLTMHQKVLEDTFLGQLDTDVLVDPIAIYCDV